MSVVTTNDKTYDLLLKPRIKIKSNDGLQTYYTYDAFNEGASDIIVNSLEVDNSIHETGTYNIVIEDYDHVIDFNKLQHSKVYIEIGKKSEWLQHFLIGFTDNPVIARPRTNQRIYSLNGFGVKIRSAELMIEIQEAADVQGIDNPNAEVDSNFNINNIFRRVMTNKFHRPLKKESIVDVTGWKLEGIADNCNVNVPVLDYQFTYLNNIFDDLCAIGGYDWFVDMSTGEEILYLVQPQSLHSGVTIKSGDLKSGTTDNAEKTSYINSSFNVENNSSLEVASASRLITNTISDKKQATASFGGTGLTNTTNKAIAQQFELLVEDRRVSSVAFIMSKTGDPQSSTGNFHAKIVLDNNNKPTGATIYKFNVSIANRGPTPKTVFLNTSLGKPFAPIDPNLFFTGPTKFWLVIHQRSGTSTTNNNPNLDEANTLNWHHNNIFNTTQTLLNATAIGGDVNTPLTALNWVTNDKGPIYSYGIFSDVRRLQSKTNITAKRNSRLKEVYVDTSFLSDPKSIDLYLTNLLNISSKPRRGLNSFSVTVPNNYLFRPYQWVSFSDTKSGTSGNFQLQRARYSMGRAGARNCEITLGSNESPVFGTFNCEN